MIPGRTFTFFRMSVNWDQQYREEETPWDKGASSPPLLEWIDSHPGTLQGRVFVPGCGLGHDVRALAEVAEIAAVTGYDLSPTAIKQAEALSRSPKVHYEVGDLFALDKRHREVYDWIWEHTCFCAIDPAFRDLYIDAVYGALKPGGHFLGVFYLDPYDEEHQPGDGPPHGSTVAELLGRFTDQGRFTLLESVVPTRCYPGREGLEQILLFVRN